MHSTMVNECIFTVILIVFMGKLIFQGSKTELEIESILAHRVPP